MLSQRAAATATRLRLTVEKSLLNNGVRITPLTPETACFPSHDASHELAGHGGCLMQAASRYMDGLCTALEHMLTHPSAGVSGKRCLSVLANSAGSAAEPQISPAAATAFLPAAYAPRTVPSQGTWRGRPGSPEDARQRDSSGQNGIAQQRQQQQQTHNPKVERHRRHGAKPDLHRASYRVDRRPAPSARRPPPQHAAGAEGQRAGRRSPEQAAAAAVGQQRDEANADAASNSGAPRVSERHAPPGQAPVDALGMDEAAAATGDSSTCTEHWACMK